MKRRGGRCGDVLKYDSFCWLLQRTRILMHQLKSATLYQLISKLILDLRVAKLYLKACLSDKE